ncbi:ion transporter [Marinobacter halodurans]|uniref:Ion transporter n=1 Tax=Marinobacter halodurans TaxID=2528979 RepID=A0ABY1ZFG3_9GAMM|nr:ion transporter [Marinobacter halodurans]TBW49537.1 ion transporter [Marinobacter halodurans]
MRTTRQTTRRPGQTQLNRLLEHPAFAIGITLLIIYSVLSFSFQTLPNLTLDERLFLRYSEYGVVAVFTTEYLARLYAADRPLRFAFSFFGVVDLLAILPFYLSFAVDLRTLRILRFFRLLRLLKLTRYSQALRRFARAVLIAKEELVLFTLASVMLLYLAAIGIYYFEHPAQPEAFGSIFDCLWWAVATLTTVGYGDVYPITVGGRLFTFVILMVGLGMIAVPTGILASALSSVRQTSDPERH